MKAPRNVTFSWNLEDACRRNLIISVVLYKGITTFHEHILYNKNVCLSSIWENWFGTTYITDFTWFYLISGNFITGFFWNNTAFILHTCGQRVACGSTGWRWRSGGSTPWRRPRRARPRAAWCSRTCRRRPRTPARGRGGSACRSPRRAAPWSNWMWGCVE